MRLGRTITENLKRHRLKRETEPNKKPTHPLSFQPFKNSIDPLDLRATQNCSSHRKLPKANLYTQNDKHRTPKRVVESSATLIKRG